MGLMCFMLSAFIYDFRKLTNHRFQIGVINRKLSDFISLYWRKNSEVHNNKKIPMNIVVKGRIKIYIHLDIIVAIANFCTVHYASLSFDMSLYSHR